MPNVFLNLVTQNEKKLDQELRKAERTIERLEKKLKDSEKATLGMKSASKGVGDEILRMASNYAGPLAAAAAVTRELKAQYELMQKNRREAADMHLTAGQARSTALLNLPSTFEGGTKAFDEMIARISEKAKLEVAQVYQASGTALSAQGSASQKQLESALTLAATLQSKTGNQVQAADVSASILDVMKATGLQDAKAALGFVRQAGTAARVTSLRGQLRFIPGISAAAAMGDTAEQAMETQAAISQMIVDPTGERTASGYINLIKNLKYKELIPEEYTDQLTGKKKTRYKALQGASTAERTANLQKIFAESSSDEKAAIIKSVGGEKALAVLNEKDTDKRKRIIEKLGGEAAMAPFIEAMLSNTNKFQEVMLDAQNKIEKPTEKSARETDNLLRTMGEGKYGVILEADREIKKTVEKTREGQTVQALEAKAKQLFESKLEAEGFTAAGRSPAWFLEMQNWFSKQVGNVNFADTLSNRVMELKDQGRIDAKTADRLTTTLSQLSDRMIEFKNSVDKNTESKKPSGPNANPNAQEVD